VVLSFQEDQDQDQGNYQLFTITIERYVITKPYFVNFDYSLSPLGFLFCNSKLYVQ